MHYSHQCFAGSSQRTDSRKRRQASRQPRLRYWRLISLPRLPAPKPAERNGVTANTEVEVPAAGEAMAMEMVTDMATGIATGTVTEMETGTGMVMDVVTETATAMVMAMAMATTMATGMETGTGMVMDVVTETATAMAMAMAMATTMATGMETGTGMVMDVVTETATAMAMAMAMATTMAMEMATATMEVAVMAIDIIFADSTSRIGQLRKTWRRRRKIQPRWTSCCANYGACTGSRATSANTRISPIHD
ncbi:hypothetical protein CY35_01G026600 [Sphagnum magellanicum]|nr:hypothetical protein CY35_01G026600 [Sphagnum magellanicum]